ncbi:MAG: hypothetical protein H6845_00240 [Alphaproteobacteria bacterium]|nr:MAG: hypothetical protein H6845_00240 [Alphaproteobacteria bacterium]
MYCECLVYHISYLILFSAYLHLQYGQYKKLMPDILCISNEFLYKWPNITGYRVIGELKFSHDNLDSIKQAILNLKPSAILWSAEYGTAFKEILELCIKNNVCMNILDKDDNIRKCEAGHCIRAYKSNASVANQIIVICGDNLEFNYALFSKLVKNNKVFLLINKSKSLTEKFKLQRLFGRNAIITDLAQFLSNNNATVIHSGGLTSIRHQKKELTLLQNIESIAKVAAKHNSKFILLNTHLYSDYEFINQLMVSAANIARAYNGYCLSLPYILEDVRYNLYNLKFKQELFKSIYISDKAAWFSINSTVLAVIDYLQKGQTNEIHGAFLSKSEIFSCLNLTQRAWNIWPKKLDYIRGYEICKNPISPN